MNQDTTDMAEILIVEDERDLREVLTFNLELAGYTVKAVPSAEKALELINDNIALILLDIMLPGMSGLQLSTKLRQEMGSHVPIIFLTALAAESDLLNGFSSGCDDYISKPFAMNEVIARVKAVLRRTVVDAPTQHNKLEFKDLHIDLDTMSVILEGEKLPLSRKEFDILAMMAASPDTYFTRAALISSIWKDTPYVLDRTVDVHIARLRGKLGKYHDLIKNRSGFGYYLDSSYEV